MAVATHQQAHGTDNNVEPNKSICLNAFTSRLSVSCQFKIMLLGTELVMLQDLRRY